MKLVELLDEKLILLACGSFNPPTRMHLDMFVLARRHLEQQYGLQVVEGIMSPVADQFGKLDLLPARHRLRMAELAALNYDWIRVDSFECTQKEWMRTMCVLEHHQKRADERARQIGQKLRVIMLCGADLVDTFTRILPSGEPLWQMEHLRWIIVNNGIVVVSRPGSTARATVARLPLTADERANIIFVEDFKESDISSTRVRESLRAGAPIEALVHPNVERYIRDNHLYVKQAYDSTAPTHTDAPAARIHSSVNAPVVALAPRQSYRLSKRNENNANKG